MMLVRGQEAELSGLGTQIQIYHILLGNELSNLWVMWVFR